jgi:hypothetical protein
MPVTGRSARQIEAEAFASFVDRFKGYANTAALDEPGLHGKRPLRIEA